MELFDQLISLRNGGLEIMQGKIRRPTAEGEDEYRLYCLPAGVLVLYATHFVHRTQHVIGIGSKNRALPAAILFSEGESCVSDIQLIYF